VSPTILAGIVTKESTSLSSPDAQRCSGRFACGKNLKLSSFGGGIKEKDGGGEFNYDVF
jgi:hypothetical protein